jgi:hypothetical protein
VETSLSAFGRRSALPDVRSTGRSVIRRDVHRLTNRLGERRVPHLDAQPFRDALDRYREQSSRQAGRMCRVRGFINALTYGSFDQFSETFRRRQHSYCSKEEVGVLSLERK